MTRDPEYVINPHCDAVCRRSEVLFAEYIMVGQASELNWLVVHLKNGTTLTSELKRNQPNLEQMMTRMYLDGVKIKKVVAKLDARV